MIEIRKCNLWGTYTLMRLCEEYAGNNHFLQILNLEFRMICQWSLHKFFLNERAPSFCHDLVIDPFYRMKRPMTLCRIWAVLKLTCSETGLPLREEKGHTMVWLWKKPLNNSWASTANWFIYFIASLGKAIFLKFFKTIRKFPGA